MYGACEQAAMLVGPMINVLDSYMDKAQQRGKPNTVGLILRE